VINCVSNLRQVDGFLWVHSVSSTNKTNHHDITVILLKVVLNTTPPLKVVISITVNVLYTTFICDLPQVSGFLHVLNMYTHICIKLKYIRYVWLSFEYDK